jgi:putative phosphoribosyl transferase
MFNSREDAGKLLAQKLESHKGERNAIILGVPRGGVPVAYEAAKLLGIPLDIIVVKKIGFPGNEELALGAVGQHDYVINEDLAPYVSRIYIEEQAKVKQKEVKERYELLRGGKPAPDLSGKVVIIIDDGIATGTTMIMAVRLIRKQSPKKIIVAVPVAPPSSVERLKEVTDEVVCLLKPEDFMAIGEFYRDFGQVADEEVRRLLEVRK